MREILVISGKGGTGKTSLTAAFAHLAENKIICDLDVDAPDLHLLLSPEVQQRGAFMSGALAEIDPESCTACGRCFEMCRFGAISRVDGKYAVQSHHCEGCKVCVAFCPSKAIEWLDRYCGDWSVSETRFGPMVHAQLFPGQENSGKLVSLLKQKARTLAKERGLDLILSDGAPGIGCPVISSLSQTSLAVIVTEPTPSGLHDFERVLGLCEHFRIPAAVIINKYDLNLDLSDQIARHAEDKSVSVLGRLPHHEGVVEAMLACKAVTEMPESDFSNAVKSAWQAIQNRLETLSK